MNLDLSNRELQVIQLVADENSSKQIALVLEISKRTVDRHRYNICKKLGITGNNSLIQFSIKNRKYLLKLKTSTELNLDLIINDVSNNYKIENKFKRRTKL
ncbi:MAG: helix-turn-helix transcriptional regulator [Bacteroidetes bacterium]|nr:helix-turn-helix transcriptional regulator [Bacteroidota bacterium]MBU1114339.1 helix-turn-helix transcriptional regulator [Bacteroidota bacterium]MBU1797117.1 helix-turn-helix transcriptional regulator [Bacteroidota bacterium]